MAEQIGKWPVGSTAVASLNSRYSDSVNNVGREVIVCSASISGIKFYGLRYGRMAPAGHFEFYGSLASDRLFRDFNNYTANVLGVKFSADKEHAVVFLAGTTTPNANTGLKFFKRASDGKYDQLTTPQGALSCIYDFDISDDGQFAAATSASSNYIDVFKRTGDVWAQVSVESGLVQTTNGVAGGIRRIFDHNNMIHLGTNSKNSAVPIIQTLIYNDTSNLFERQTPTGLAYNIDAAGLDYYYDGTNYYYACADISTPYLYVYKSSDGLDFTPLTVNGIPSYQHYAPAWDPSGTYLFTAANNIGVQMAVYKRDGDTLTYIDSPFDELFPVFSVTTIKYVSWSPDSKYLIIVKNAGRDDDDGAWMYRRVGDNFYRVSGPHYYQSTHADSGDVSMTGDWLFDHSSATINYIHWK